jgi:6-phosphogluconolactonase
VRFGKSPAESASNYENDIIKYFGLNKGGIPEFDMIMLGVGEDGHTASIFPGSREAVDIEKIAVAVDGPDKPRITLTLRTIANSRFNLFLVTGQRKAKIIEKIFKDKESKPQARQAFSESGENVFILDKDAAERLQQRR